MIFHKRVAICSDFKWLGFRISDPILNLNHLQTNLFSSIQTSSYFRSLLWGCFQYVFGFPVVRISKLLFTWHGKVSFLILVVGRLRSYASHVFRSDGQLPVLYPHFRHQSPSWTAQGASLATWRHGNSSINLFYADKAALLHVAFFSIYETEGRLR